MSATHPTDVAAVDSHGHDDHDHKPRFFER